MDTAMNRPVLADEIVEALVRHPKLMRDLKAALKDIQVLEAWTETKGGLEPRWVRIRDGIIGATVVYRNTEWCFHLLDPETNRLINGRAPSKTMAMKETDLRLVKFGHVLIEPLEYHG